LSFRDRIAAGLAHLKTIEQADSLRQVRDLLCPIQLFLHGRPFIMRWQLELLEIVLSLRHHLG
jgi:hypothetical protein